MNRLRICCVLAAFCCNGEICGAVFERDWQTTGDGLLTYDNVHRREWLDLTVSRVDQFPEPWLENAIAQISPGGMFDGFRLAKRKDVVALANSAGIAAGTSDPSINYVPVSELIDLLGATLDVSHFVRSRRSTGFIDEVDPWGRQVGSEFLWNKQHASAPPSNASYYISASNDLLTLGSTGLMLWRPVPEPSALLLVAILLVAQSICSGRGRGRLAPRLEA
jgi:hypothetical protein